MMFEQITIIGLGLIGSSLARAIKAHNLAGRVVASDRDPAVCETIVRLGLADEAISNNRKAVIGSDLVIISVPQSAYAGIAGEIGPALRPGAIVTDTGSVKKAAVEALQQHLPGSVHLVAGHPIAGTENSGPEAGFAELFQGRWCILTPTADCDIRAVEKVTNFWEACGARIEVMEPDHHDLVLGITSHLPHLIAFTIVDTAKNLEDDIRSEVIKYSASGFRGFTRIAASDPVMWRDVFLNNKPAVLEMLQRFTEDLTAMQKAIRRGDGDYLFEVFSRTRSIRRRISEMGPEGLPAPAEKISQ